MNDGSQLYAYVRTINTSFRFLRQHIVQIRGGGHTSFGT